METHTYIWKDTDVDNTVSHNNFIALKVLSALTFTPIMFTFPNAMCLDMMLYVSSLSCLLSVNKFL